MLTKAARKYMSELGKKGGPIAGQKNKEKGSEYFKMIRAKRKTWNKLGPRKPRPPKPLIKAEDLIASRI